LKEALFALMGGLFQDIIDVIVAEIFGGWVQKLEG